DGAERRAGAVAPFERQADELERALPDQRLEIAQAFDVRDVEVEARLVHQRVDLALRPRSHGVDAEVHDPLLRQPFGRRDIDAGIVGRIGRRRERARVVAGAQQHGALLRDRHAGLLYCCVEVRGRDLGARLDVPQVDADGRYDAVLERIFVDRRAGLAEVARRVDVRAAVVRHGEIHHAVALHVAGVDEGLLVRLPDAVNDRRLSRIARRAMIELAAQVDDADGYFSLDSMQRISLALNLPVRLITTALAR